MSSYITIPATYSKLDEVKFDQKDDKYFGAPFEWVYAYHLDCRGRVKDWRRQTFAHLLAIRYLKQHDRECWIWDERYNFEEIVSYTPNSVDYNSIRDGQMLFSNKFDSRKRQIIASLAHAHRPVLNPGGKTEGRPDGHE